MTDAERVAVLEMNAWLRAKHSKGPLFQKLRRCAMCAQNPCAEPGQCREAFHVWAKQQWNGELRKEWHRRQEDEARYRALMVCAPNFDDGN